MGGASVAPPLKEDTMNQTIRKALAPLSLIVAGACFAGSAHAECFAEALSQAPKMQKESWHGQDVRMMNVDWRHHDDDIVGFWNIVVTGKGNGNQFDGQIVDLGLQQYHDDGTEFLNSANQNPATQNYCFGVWEKTGPHTYKLNHFGYTYDGGSPNKVNGVVRIRDELVLSHDGNELHGTEITEIFNADRNNLLTIKGVLVGKRVTVDTTAQEIR
jgi:hypothetical protein